MSPSRSPVASSQTDVVAEQELREPRHFRVFLHNDDYTTMDFVAQILREVFRKSPVEANRITQAVHENGRCECGVYPAEVAETKVAIVHSRARAAGYPLRCSLEDV